MGIQHGALAERIANAGCRGVAQDDNHPQGGALALHVGMYHRAD